MSHKFIYVSATNKIMEEIYKSVNDTDPIVVKPTVLLRPGVCSLKNAINTNIDGKLFCLAHIGQRKHRDALQSCRKLNATLPLPKSITEYKHFIESFKRLGMDEKMNDFSTKIVLDIRRLPNQGKLSSCLALILKVLDYHTAHQ